MAGREERRWLLAGSYTDGREGMGLYLISMEDGVLRTETSFGDGENPSFFCLDRCRRKVYVACESERESSITVYDMYDPIPVQKMEGYGTGLCHLTLDETADKIYGSCYSSGDFFRIDLKTGKCDAVCRGRGGGHAHGTALSPFGGWLLGTDLGENRIILFTRDLQEVSSLKFAGNLGPRQLLFPQMQGKASGLLYVIHEKKCALSCLTFDEQRGRLTERGRLGLKREELLLTQFPGTAAWEKDGIHLLVPVRGTDRIDRINTESLFCEGSFDSGGNWPRMVSVGKRGEVLVANQKSGTLCCFVCEQGEYRLKSQLRIQGVSCVEELT